MATIPQAIVKVGSLCRDRYQVSVCLACVSYIHLLPELGCSPLQNDVARQLEQDIAKEVQCQASEVLVASHTKVGGETFDTSVGHCRKLVWR